MHIRAKWAVKFSQDNKIKEYCRTNRYLKVLILTTINGGQMNRFLITFYLVCNIALLPTNIWANDTHRQAAERFLQIVDMEKVLQQSIEQMLNLKLKQKPALVPYKEVVLRFFSKYMSYESLKEDLIKLYVEEFTEKELNEIIAFYETQTGRKVLKKLPIVMARGGQLGASKIRPNIGELKKMIEAQSERIQ